MFQVLPSTSRQLMRVQPKSAKGKISRVQEKSNRGVKIQEALPSGSSLGLVEDKNARTLQMFQRSESSLGLGDDKRTLQMFPRTRSEMPRVDSDSRVSMSGFLQMLQNVQNDQNERRPGRKLVEVGSKSYFVVGGHLGREESKCEKSKASRKIQTHSSHKLTSSQAQQIQVHSHQAHSSDKLTSSQAHSFQVHSHKYYSDDLCPVTD